MKLKYVGPKVAGMHVQFPIGVKNVGQYKKVVLADPYIELTEKEGKLLLALNAHTGHFVEVNDEGEEIYSTVGSGDSEGAPAGYLLTGETEYVADDNAGDAVYVETDEPPVDEIVTEPEAAEEAHDAPKPKRKYTKRKKA